MRTDQKGNLYILMTAVLWSMGGVLVKVIPAHPIAINGARSLIAFLFFVCYRRGIKIRINRLVIAAAFCVMLTNICYVAATKLTTAANAIVLQYLAPVFVLIWDCIYQKRKPRKSQLLIMGTAFLGMFLFFMDQLDGGHLLGNLIAIFSSLTFSGVFFINSLPDSSSNDASMLAFLMSFFISIPYWKDIWHLDGKGMLAVLALGIFQVGLPYAIFAKGVRMTSPVNASLIGLMEALLNPVWVFLFYGERVGKFALLGAALILLSVASGIRQNAS